MRLSGGQPIWLAAVFLCKTTRIEGVSKFSSGRSGFTLQVLMIGPARYRFGACRQLQQQAENSLKVFVRMRWMDCDFSHFGSWPARFRCCLGRQLASFHSPACCLQKLKVLSPVRPLAMLFTRAVRQVRPSLSKDLVGVISPLALVFEFDQVRVSPSAALFNASFNVSLKILLSSLVNRVAGVSSIKP